MDERKRVRETVRETERETRIILPGQLGSLKFKIKGFELTLSASL